MAIGDIGMFLPAESHYKTPGAYDKMLEAEALKRSDYLSSMDMFYAELEEMERQFNETLGFEVETRDLELDWAREKFETEVELEERSLALGERAQSATETYQAAQIAVQNRELDLMAQGESNFLGGPTEEEQWEYFTSEREEETEEEFDPYSTASQRAAEEAGITSGEIRSGRVTGKS